MGQGASSSRCAPTTSMADNVSAPQQSISPRGRRWHVDMTERSSSQSGRPGYDAPEDNPVGIDSSAAGTSRRRMYSPDPDSIDSRRSSRIRRRISRFVSQGVGRAEPTPRDRDEFVSEAEVNGVPTSPYHRPRLPRVRTRFLHRPRPLHLHTSGESPVMDPSVLNTPRLNPFSTARPHVSFQPNIFGGNQLRPSSQAGDAHVQNEAMTAPVSQMNIDAEDRHHEHMLSDATYDTNVLDDISDGSSREWSYHIDRPVRQMVRSDVEPDLTSSSSLPGEDQTAVLSRLLSVAAAATAASLVGTNTAVSDVRDATGGSLDGNFESFLRALQNGRLASVLRNSGREEGGFESASADTHSASASTAPLNFFRMFRFGTAASTEQESIDSDNPRMIPVIIVGIRAVTPRETPIYTSQSSSTETSFPSLGNREETDRAVQTPTSQILDHPVLVESIQSRPQSHHPVVNPHQSSEIRSGYTDGNPQGHHFDQATLPNRNDSETNESDRPTRRTRGISGRSGTAPEGTRSWIIYVLGGSYPENHPLLTTPSLFTETPTYEDMILLSSLIGPAKPIVASNEEIDSAGGLVTASLLQSASEFDQTNIYHVGAGERCLVCLCDFEEGEACRQLLTCKHTFHRACIDEWLTTGRNSCPLCRTRGVEPVPAEA